MVIGGIENEIIWAEMWLDSVTHSLIRFDGVNKNFAGQIIAADELPLSRKKRWVMQILTTGIVLLRRLHSNLPFLSTEKVSSSK